jgi:hypothetical protein
MDVGVTRYSTDPIVVVPGLVSIWLMIAPDPAVAPVIPPVIVPTVQVNELGADAVSPIPALVPLQIIADEAVVTTGDGLTVAVKVNGIPGQEPVSEVGVMI